MKKPESEVIIPVVLALLLLGFVVYGLWYWNYNGCHWGEGCDRLQQEDKQN